jgi:hypothetical protein
MLVEHAAWQQGGVADGLDLHLPQHLRNDDLDVLVVDFNPLAAVDVLNLADQVPLHFFSPEIRRMSCGTSGPSTRASPDFDDVTGVHPHVLAVSDQVLSLDARLVA